MICLMISLPVLSQAQLNCNDSTIATTPTTRFTDNMNGTVTDKKTKLMWMRCGESLDWNSLSKSCQFSHFRKNLNYNWKSALNRVTEINANFGGYHDWRLPNINELHSIIERQCYLPALNQVIFPAAILLDEYYWSSSQSTDDGTEAWAIDFNRGYDFTVSKDGYFGQILLVRDTTN